MERYNSKNEHPYQKSARSSNKCCVARASNFGFWVPHRLLICNKISPEKATNMYADEKEESPILKSAHIQDIRSEELNTRLNYGSVHKITENLEKVYS